MENNEEKIFSLIKEEKKAYFKKWRQANKDKVKQHNAKYWKKLVEKKLNKN